MNIAVASRAKTLLVEEFDKPETEPGFYIIHCKDGIASWHAIIYYKDNLPNHAKSFNSYPFDTLAEAQDYITHEYEN